MPKCNFNKVAKQLYWNQASAWVLSYEFAASFQNTYGGVPLIFALDVCKAVSILCVSGGSALT